MKNKIKILVVFHDSIYNSGGTRSLLDLIDRLILEPSMEFVCLFPKETGSAIDYLRMKPVSIISCRYWYATGPITASCANKLLLQFKFVLGWLNIQRLIRKKLAFLDIDIVYSNTGVIFAGAWISEALHVPHIWHIREFLDEDHGIKPLMGWNNYYKYINKRATIVVMISEALKNKHMKGISGDKIRVIHDDLSPSYLLKQEKPWEFRKQNILFAGTICEGKGQLVALKALALLRKKEIFPKLFIAGMVKERDQYYYEILQKEITDNHLSDQVEFLGQVENLSGIRTNCGIGIVASRSEAFGRVTIEGMLADMVMIGADAGGTTELIFDGINGFLFPFNNSHRLAEILNNVLTSSSEDTATIRAEALKIGKEFIQGKCADQIGKLFMDCIK